MGWDFSDLFNKGKTTHTYTIGKDTVQLTPTGLSPEELVKKVFETGAGLIILSDTEHREISIKSALNKILADKSIKITKFAYEADIASQPAYDSFAKGNDKALKELILNPADYYAPDESRSDKRKKYFDANWQKFEIARDNKIKVAFIDAENPSLRAAAAVARNNVLLFERNQEIMKFTWDKKEGRPKDLHAMTESEFSNLRTDIHNTLKQSYGIGLLPQISALSRDNLTSLTRDFAQYIKVPDLRKLTSYEAFQKLAKTKLEELEATKIRAEDRRDDWRNKEMAQNISAAISPAATGERAVLLMGAGHQGAKEHPELTSNIPNLEAQLRSKFRNKVTRIDIVPVSRYNAGKLGAAIGGRNGADYTIFVETDNHEYIFQDTGKSVPAKEGPHKDKLKPLQISQAPEQIIVAHDDTFSLDPAHQFHSGLHTALPKTPPTKTV